VGERFLTGTRQNEVSVRDSDVVWPDVNLFHTRQGPGIADESDLRSKRRGTEPPSPFGLPRRSRLFRARRSQAAREGREVYVPQLSLTKAKRTLECTIDGPLVFDFTGRGSERQRWTDGMTTECETSGCMHQKRLHGPDGHCRACACSSYTRTGPGHQTKAARKEAAQALRRW